VKLATRFVGFGLALAAGLCLASAPAWAALVYDTDTNMQLSGSRTTSVGGGLVIGGGNVTTASLAWTITDNGDGTLHYAYTFDEDSQQSISHFVLDLSDNCTATSGCLMNPEVGSGTFNLEYGTFTTNNGNPGFPGLIVGVKFDDLSSDNPFVFEFDSNRTPVWGNFYAKGGNGKVDGNGFAIFNDGADDHASANILHFIARPDTERVPPAEVPAPLSLILVGAGFGGIGFLHRRWSR
jgi:hypothetical protein